MSEQGQSGLGKGPGAPTPGAGAATGKAHHAKRRYGGLVVLAVLAVALVCGGWYYREHYGVSAPDYITVVVSRGELLQTVTASGQLDPVTKVEVGSQISGNIKELPVDFNSTVKKGQVIAQLDPASYEAAYAQAQGDVLQAKAAQSLAQLSLERAKSLRNNRLNTEADYEQATATMQQAEAQVKIKEGNLKKTKVDLDRCTIYSPIDGMVISRNVNVGQTVAASLSAPTLFILAADLSKMQIEAKVAEADIGMVEVGQETDFNVDAFATHTFHGKVKQVRNMPNVEQNVVTYDTIIEVDNPKQQLKPGMTANVSIIVARRENALKIPNAALRFRPPEVVEAKKAEASAESAAKPSRSAKKSGSAGSKKEKKDKKKSERTVYVLSSPAGSTSPVLTPVQIKTGISDGSQTEVVESLKEGDVVVTAMRQEKEKSLEISSLFGAKKKR